MRKNKQPIRFTGQHFTIDQALIADAIKIAKLNENDIVLDIGAGKGFLTVHLARHYKNVVAIENDKLLLNILKKRFFKKPNVQIIDTDFRNYTIPTRNFKVVSNIPFRITSDILKSLMFDNVEYFMGGSLILQLEPAQRLFSEKLFNPYAVFYHTFYKLKLMYEITPKSFMPPPNVMSALLMIGKKEAPMSVGLKEKYLNFLFFLLYNPHLSARKALMKLFRKSQVMEVFKKYGIGVNSQITSLSANQWSGCFIEMLKKVPEKYHPMQ